MAEKKASETEKELLFFSEDGPRPRLHSSIPKKELLLKSEPNTDFVNKKVCGHKVTGGCLCKLSVLFYLLLCVGLSVAYVVVRYEHETDQDQEDQPLPWIPGAPPVVQQLPKPILPFQDLPYTEWIPDRMTYQNHPFANWSTLPEELNNIKQLSHGFIGKLEGAWILTVSELFFGMYSEEGLKYLNVSEALSLEVTPGSQVTVGDEGRVYLTTALNITLLDCSEEYEDYCDLLAFNNAPLPFSTVYSTAYSLSTKALWLGTDKGLFKATTELPSPLIAVPDELYYDGDITVHNVSEVIDEVTTLLWRSGISSERSHPAFTLQPVGRNRRQPSLAYASSQGIMNTWKQRQQLSFGVLVVGTKDKVYFFDGSKWWFEWVSVWYNGLGGVLDGTATDLAVGPGGEIYISNNVSLTRLNTDYTFDRIGPLEGLPYNQLKSLCYVNYKPLYPHPTKGYDSSKPGMLWIGTSKGYTLFNTESSSFDGYFYGPRWHSGEGIKAIAGIGANAVIMLTETGLTVVRPEQWTLARKAEHYQSMLARHIREPGIVSDCPLTNYIPSTCAPYTTDNDGLWTAWLVASESLRYQVTKDPAARENSWALYNGLYFLNNVTGVHGLMARSVLNENASIPDGTWHNSSTQPGWIWKGDTSSDEVAGHMFAYPFVLDMAADSEEEKTEVMELLDSIVGYIKDNAYHLIDVTNHSTTWGVWAPSQLNLNRSWADEHGINSLQILSYLLSAYRVTGKQEYWEAWKELAIDEHYGLNMINQKITFPRDNNYSDDELAFLPYFTYFYSLKMMKPPVDPLISQYANLSLERTWRTVGLEKSSAWTALYAYCRGAPQDPGLMEQVVWSLRNWPLELIQWNTTNSHRLDIVKNPEQDRDYHSGSQSVRVLPPKERGQLRWNANPYQLDSGGSDSEMDPGAWLFPYWFGRWTKML